MTVPRFDPLQTGRWTIRPLRPDDVEPLWIRRNDVDTALMQDWEIPYPRAAAESLVDAMLDLGGVPPADGWFQLAVDDTTTGTPVGDLALRLTFDGRCAEIGYTVDAEARGQHVATDAAARLTRWLFDTVGVSRVGAEMHPDNFASARVAERIGMICEGTTLRSFWVGDDNSDNVLYGMTHEMWEQWTNRVRHEPTEVRLVEVDGRNVDSVMELAMHRSQHRLARPVAEWFAVLHAPNRPGAPTRRPWLRAIVADGQIVGALLLSAPDEARSTAQLWRIMIDRLHQNRGIGRVVLDLAVGQARSWDADGLTVNWCDLPGTAGPMYLDYGFVPTGTDHDGEIQARLTL